MEDDLLVRFLRTRREEDFAALVARTRPSVERIVREHVRDADAADDVMQDVYAKVFACAWKPEEVSLERVYLAAKWQAKTCCRAEAQRRGRYEPLSEAGDAPANGHAAPLDDQLDVLEAVDSLPPTLGVCVRLKYFEGLDVTEVAATLHLSRSAAHERLRSAHKMLERRLSPSALALLFEKGPSLFRGFVEEPASSASDRVNDAARPKTRIHFGARTLAASGVAALFTILATLAFFRVFAATGRGAERFTTHDRPEDKTTSMMEETMRSPGGDVLSRTAPRQTADAGTIPTASPPARDGGSRNEGEKTRESTRDATPPVARIRVADETGALVKAGTLELVPGDDLLAVDSDLEPSIPGESEARLAKALAWLVSQRRDLSEENPVEIAALPAELDSIEVKAIVSADGYSTSRSTKLRAVTRETVNVEIWLERKRSCDVLVKDAATLRPLVHARVAFDRGSEKGGSEEGGRIAIQGGVRLPTDRVGETGPDGHLVLDDLRDREYALTISADGHEAKRLRAERLGEKLDVSLEPAKHDEESGSVAVTVLDEAGHGLPEAEVEVLIRGFFDDARAQRTDARGIARFERIPPGPHFVQLSDEWIAETRAKGYDVMKPIRIEPGEEAAVTLAPARKGIDKAEPGKRIVREGMWELDDPIDSSEEEFAKHPVLGTASIRGQVTGIADVAGVEVTATGPGRRAVVKTDGAGRFEIHGAVPGKHTLRARGLKKGLASTSVDVEVEDAAGPAPVEIRVVEGGTIAIDVKAKTGTHPAIVFLICRDAQGRESALVATTASGSKREWTSLEPLVPGHYTLDVRAPGFVPAKKDFAVEPGRRALVDVELEPKLEKP